MRTEMTEVTFNTWISAALNPLKCQGDTLYIEAVTDFYYQFVMPRYTALISNALSQAAGKPMKAKLLTPAQAREFLQKGGSEENTAWDPALNPKYTFDTFVIGNNNRLAQAAALAVAESPADTYNPLFIYGGVGLGKTHLMHAIGHYVLSQNPNFRVRDITTETFTNEMIVSIQNRTMAEFREKYRNIDMLLVDDIQFLAGREGTQEEFFHTFNALHGSGRQIVVSSDKPPKEIPKLEERLQSRFEWGLVADIAKPDEETRFEILRKKTENDGINVPVDVLHMIAERISSNIRELEGALTRLIAYASLTGRNIDRELAESALKEIFAASEPRHVTCEDIIRAVASYYNVRPEDIRGPKRNREFIQPRQMAMFLSREMADVSLEMIGNAFNRDHTTVMHACQKVAADMKSSPSLVYAAEDMKRQLHEKN